MQSVCRRNRGSSRSYLGPSLKYRQQSPPKISNEASEGDNDAFLDHD